MPPSLGIFNRTFTQNSKYLVILENNVFTMCFCLARYINIKYDIQDFGRSYCVFRNIRIFHYFNLYTGTQSILKIRFDLLSNTGYSCPLH